MVGRLGWSSDPKPRTNQAAMSSPEEAFRKSVYVSRLLRCLVVLRTNGVRSAIEYIVSVNRRDVGGIVHFSVWLERVAFYYTPK